MSNYLTLTEKDRLVLDSFKAMMDGMALYLGDGYELILHSLESLEHSVIKIINGYHSGRKEGSPITDLALDMLKEIQSTGGLETRVYFNERGNTTLRSCTIPVQGGDGRVIGLFCINFYMNTPISSIMAKFSPDSVTRTAATETLTDNASALIQSFLENARFKVESDAAITASNKNKEIIGILFHEGVFNLKDAVQTVATGLGISKNTVYLHLRNLNR